MERGGPGAEAALLPCRGSRVILLSDPLLPGRAGAETRAHQNVGVFQAKRLISAKNAASVSAGGITSRSTTGACTSGRKCGRSKCRGSASSSGAARAQAGGGAGPRGPGPGPGGQGGPGGPGEAIPVSGASPDRRAPVCAPCRGRCQARGHGNTPRPVDGERGRGRGWGRQSCRLLPPGLHPVAVSPALIPLTAIQDLRSFCLCQLYCLNYVIKD